MLCCCERLKKERQSTALAVKKMAKGEADILHKVTSDYGVKIKEFPKFFEIFILKVKSFFIRSLSYNGVINC